MFFCSIFPRSIHPGVNMYVFPRSLDPGVTIYYIFEFQFKYLGYNFLLRWSFATNYGSKRLFATSSKK